MTYVLRLTIATLASSVLAGSCRPRPKAGQGQGPAVTSQTTSSGQPAAAARRATSRGCRFHSSLCCRSVKMVSWICVALLAPALLSVVLAEVCPAIVFVMTNVG